MEIEKLTYTIADKCSSEELFAFMKSVEGDFIPPLFSRINAEQYVDKIIARATINTCRCEGEIVGLIAVYDNDLMNREAYITFLAVVPFWRRHHVAARLLQLTDLSRQWNGMKKIKVSTCNPDVARFYQKNEYSIERKEYDTNANTTRIYLNKS